MSDRYRRDSLGFVDEGLNFVVENHYEVKLSSVPAEARIWGELFVDAAGGVNFKFHSGSDFQLARRSLRKFVSIVQQRIDTARECPFYEPEGEDFCVYQIGLTLCGYPTPRHHRIDGSPMDHAFLAPPIINGNSECKNCGNAVCRGTKLFAALVYSDEGQPSMLRILCESVKCIRDYARVPLREK